jgi:hypothetical protein
VRARRPGAAGRSIVICPSAGASRAASNGIRPSLRQRSWAARISKSTPAGHRANSSQMSPSRSATIVTRAAPAGISLAAALVAASQR